MSAPPRMVRVGLTGGIASGKSTVAAMFAAHGAFVVDADAVVHDLLAPGGAAERAVVERFGAAILATAGGIDRARLAAVVFADPAARADLEAVLHPQVRSEIARRVAHARPAVAVIEAALLVETGSYRDYDVLVVTACDPDEQVRRLVERSGLTVAQAHQRLAAQATNEQRAAVADVVIDTGGTLDATRAQVARAWARLARSAS